MTKQKKVNFLAKLDRILCTFTDRELKIYVGDSVNNHRTISVNQLIRLLSKPGINRRNRQLGRHLRAVYQILRPFMAYQRSKRCRRSDAYSITEFIVMLNTIIDTERVAQSLENLI